jgi:hypothetical protein
MGRSKLGKVPGFLGALTLGVCLVGYGQTVSLLGGAAGGGDVNQPGPPEVNVPWDPARHLSADWDFVALTSRVYNPLSYPGRDMSALNRSLSLSGHVDVTDSNGFIGLCILSMPVLAVDQDGNELSGRVEGRRPPYNTRYEPPLVDWRRTLPGQWARQLAPYGFSLSATLDPNADYPLFFSRLEWSLYALAADEFETVDLAFQTTQDWVELIPGLEVLVEKAAGSARHYEYQMKVRCDRHKVCYLQSVARGTSSTILPEKIIVEMQVLNEQGERIGPVGVDYGSSVTAAGSGEETSNAGSGHVNDTEPGDQMNYTSKGQATCADCGHPATFRYRLAVKVYEREVRFVLGNVPVPSL